MFIWRSLLRLPENCSAFSSLTDKGQHSAFVALPERYPVKSARLQRGLQRCAARRQHATKCPVLGSRMGTPWAYHSASQMPGRCSPLMPYRFRWQKLNLLM